MRIGAWPLADLTYQAYPRGREVSQLALAEEASWAKPEPSWSSAFEVDIQTKANRFLALSRDGDRWHHRPQFF
jgi:hypothetical protein